MNEILQILFGLFGGMAIFIFGMNMMSECLQKAAGEKMKGILAMFTKNPVMGVLAGALTTAVLQSSSATTVMAIGFVSAGLMTLPQAISIIFGANIGTTITSQLVAFNLTGVAPFILFVGAVFIMFGKKPMVKKIGEVILGFGALFMGISMMKDAMTDLRDYQAVLDVLGSMDNPVVGILFGTAITVIVQSSSVTVSILLLMASQGLIDLSVCFYVILGCNIGSCTPAVLASLDAKKEAKRAAMIHVMFNVLGMVVIGILLAFGMEYFENFILHISGSDVGRCVANADTFFKIFQTLIFLPLSAQFVLLTRRIIPGEDQQQKEYQFQYIGKQTIFSPSTAVVETTQEIERMGGLARENMTLAMEAFFDGDQEKISRVYETEKQIDFLSKEITDYLVKINQLQLPVVDAKRIGGLFHVVSDIERIGDHAENIADAAVKSAEESLEFTKKGQKEIKEMHHKTMSIFEKSMEMFTTMDKKNLSYIMELENSIDLMERELQQNHVKRMAKGKCSPMTGILFTDLVTSLERVADHATNIAFSILENDPEEAM